MLRCESDQQDAVLPLDAVQSEGCIQVPVLPVVGRSFLLSLKEEEVRKVNLTGCL